MRKYINTENDKKYIFLCKDFKVSNILDEIIALNDRVWYNIFEDLLDTVKYIPIVVSDNIDSSGYIVKDSIVIRDGLKVLDERICGISLSRDCFAEDLDFTNLGLTVLMHELTHIEQLLEYPGLWGVWLDKNEEVITRSALIAFLRSSFIETHARLNVISWGSKVDFDFVNEIEIVKSNLYNTIKDHYLKYYAYELKDKVKNSILLNEYDKFLSYVHNNDEYSVEILEDLMSREIKFLNREGLLIYPTSIKYIKKTSGGNINIISVKN